MSKPESTIKAAEKSTKFKQYHHVVFLHLDLGIGGAEQLVINLALASLPKQKQELSKNDHSGELNSCLNAEKVSIITTHCDQNHCFDAVRKKTNGRLSQSVHVVGSFLPVTIFGRGTALCSTIRMIYIAIMAKWFITKDADVFVVDVLPTPVPFLVSSTLGVPPAKSVIFYCHFPDKLLTRDTVNGVPLQGEGNNTRTSSLFSISTLKSTYRRLLDFIEEWSMSFADLILVNSNFTKMEVGNAFPSLISPTTTNNNEEGNSTNDENKIQVLYPAIDLTKFIPPNFEQKESQLQLQTTESSTATTAAATTDDVLPIVSLNRFERKKNIELLLHAYAELISQLSKITKTEIIPPPLIISGGYDPRNPENVQYLQELQSLSKELSIPQEYISFQPSISDEKRAQLLQSALCVVYTPHREHFGIVPLEAMYAGSAVVALKSGGPMETVLDGQTGVLVDMNDDRSSTTTSLEDKLSIVLLDLVQNPKKAIAMGRKGHEHVSKHFGLEPFQRQWKDLVVKEGIPRGNQRCEKDRSGGIGYTLLVFALFIVIFSFYST